MLTVAHSGSPSKRILIMMISRFEETNNRGSFLSAPKGMEASGDDSEKPDLESLIGNDNVLIKTDNSLYKFLVTDSTLRQGKLSGGSLGENPRTAILVVSICESADGQVNETPGLSVGARAVFYIVSHAGMERLITSTVVDITLIRNGKAWSLSISSFNRKRKSPPSLIVPA